MGSKVVLVLDDDATTRRLVQAALERAGMGLMVFTAGTSEEAAELLKKQDIDLLIVDYKLQETTGSQFIQDSQGILAAIPRMMITAFPEAAEDADVQETLAKPFPTKKLVDAVAAMLELDYVE